MRIGRSWLGLCAFVSLACVAGGARDAAAQALAAAAGTAFEAAPFLIFAALAGPRLGGFAALAGCGCARSAMPGALAIPAIALCALAFGPIPTLARCVAGFGLVRMRARHTHANEAPDLFRDLEALGACAFLAALAAMAVSHASARVPIPLAFVAGLVLGTIAPCATAGVALAAGFAGTSPAIATGILCTAGLLHVPSPGETRASATPERSCAFAALLLCAALAWLALRGPSGLVTPRLAVPIAVAAAALSLVTRRLRTSSRASALLPVAMLAALVTVPKPPAYLADATHLDDAFAGERLAFDGVAHASPGGAATLTRFAITCCRLDAAPVSVRLDRGLGAFEGRWVTASGTLVERAGGLVLRTDRVRAIAAPADPFVYR